MMANVVAAGGRSVVVGGCKFFQDDMGVLISKSTPVSREWGSHHPIHSQRLTANGEVGRNAPRQMAKCRYPTPRSLSPINTLVDDMGTLSTFIVKSKRTACCHRIPSKVRQRPQKWLDVEPLHTKQPPLCRCIISAEFTACGRCYRESGQVSSSAPSPKQ